METFKKWTTASIEEVVMVLVSAVVIYTLILIYTRLCGLRSFSKMSAADFAMTVAVGSLFGSTISSKDPTILLGGVALASLFAGQFLLAVFRQRFPGLGQVVDNQPILLMAGRQIIDDHLKRANVTRSDIFAKLREANAYHYDQVLAVVFETTGDISVLHSTDSSATVSEEFLKDVVGAEYVKNPAQAPATE